MPKGRVLMAMSGGVDSSVAAALLVEQGYDVIGVTMNTWTDDIPIEIQQNEHSGCCAIGAVEDARSISNKLGIPYYVMNFQGHFAATVIDYFIDEYSRGRTPNPCIACNRYVKFSAFIQKADQLECDFIATGHYAVIGSDGRFPGRRLLGKSADLRKDQTYVLHNLTQEALARTIFPIGEMEKPKVRELARKLGLVTADKPDSQEICFVYDNDYGRFLKERIPEAVVPGPMLNTEGEVIGQHQGLPLYTVGQRKGLGLTSKVPLYVVALDPERNAVVVGEDHETYHSALFASDMNWIALPEQPSEPVRANAKIRRMAPEAGCMVYPEAGGVIRVEFDEPQRAVTPGQAVVLYQDRWVLGGGTIDRAL